MPEEARLPGAKNSTRVHARICEALTTGMNNGSNGNGRLDALKKREAEIRARIAQEKVRQQKREEKEQDRLEYIVGRAAVAQAGTDPKFAELLKPALQSVTADGEKHLLRARGLL